MPSKRKRVVVAGLGDTGLLSAIGLSQEFDVVGISPKSCLVSGQELGTRLTRPKQWAANYLMDFGRFPRLDGFRFVHGHVRGVDTQASRVEVESENKSTEWIAYDCLIVSTGVTNGFWREPSLQGRAEVQASLQRQHERIAQAKDIVIVGAGASGVGCAANIRARWPDKPVRLYFSGTSILPSYHSRVVRRIEARLRKLGVQLFAHHRAELPQNVAPSEMTRQPVTWSGGQEKTQADLVIWTVGRVCPNSGFLPSSMLDEKGFVKVDEHFRVPGHPAVFAVGDIAASDPLRSSARNWGFRVVAHNVAMLLRGREGAMMRYKASPHRWGSILGVQADGLEVFQPNGRHFRFPRWSIDTLVFPFLVHRMIYRGVRKEPKSS